MPKKTKKEKLIAEYRRKLHSLSHERVPMQSGVTETKLPETSTTPSSPSQYSLDHTPNKQAAKSAAVVGLDDFLFIRKDLISTLILIVGILCLEILIWRFVGI